MRTEWFQQLDRSFLQGLFDLFFMKPSWLEALGQVESLENV